MIQIEKPAHDPYDRRKFIIMTAGGMLCAFNFARLIPDARAGVLSIINHLSPLNWKRPRRPSTRYIILHTTEGEEEGALSKIVRFGEAHYVVTYSGKVYRTIDKEKIAKHAGRSMWEGHSAIDNYSIGIEVIGYHNKDIKEAQYTALRELLLQLKSFYNVSDENILTHSMVAYGRPNRFHDGNHRGRKRCGMLFAKYEVRARLGLKSKPDHDPDVKAGRLFVGDRELFTYLFTPKPVTVPVVSAEKDVLQTQTESSIIDGNWTAWKIARERYNHPQTVYVFPNDAHVTGDRIRDWKKIPYGTRVLFNEMDETEDFEGFLEIGKDGENPRSIAGAAWTSSSTIYFFPDGLINTGAQLKNQKSGRKLLDHPPDGTRLLVGYINGGYVKSRRPPASIAGKKWNYPSTYYRYPDGSIVSGDEVDPKAIPAGTQVFYQN